MKNLFKSRLFITVCVSLIVWFCICVLINWGFPENYNTQEPIDYSSRSSDQLTEDEYRFALGMQNEWYTKEQQIDEILRLRNDENDKDILEILWLSFAVSIFMFIILYIDKIFTFVIKWIVKISKKTYLMIKKTRKDTK
jgi:hypothetical protein